MITTKRAFGKGRRGGKRRRWGRFMSGHACAEELKLIHALYPAGMPHPVAREYRHLKVAELAKEMGLKV